ncbi:hypothetical protein JCM19238_3476 [Vibrio ponticus]|nr:hypothetical protein JCM19238_3476 [Vibrio ponticus]
MAGWRYRVCNFNKVFPLQELHICWKECTDKAEAQRLEGQLLSEYLELHYELPPLNYKFNWSE